ncbi:heterokaryon incompatibility protein-domain-containing protein [Xylariomycetidae sp. FL2044]|nr:heterokaryon incompatibility protein-domain-containing protein [Xylariomycetidae sp. FL2044]
MRLLEITPNGYRLTKDLSKEEIPPYAILSHTWGNDDDEVTFRDLSDTTTSGAALKPGHRKIQFCVNQAARNSLRYFWVDTCCIDKSSSAELTEALNSMFRWYQNASKCYVLLSDVSSHNAVSGLEDSSAALPPNFQQSRWFTRGWTLQELLAPRYVDFFSLEGHCLGNKASLRQPIHQITGIPITALQGLALTEFTLHDRKAWAANRRTKREEDMAYCLLGIFYVYLPPIYGEGKEHAFARLEEQVAKRYSGNDTMNKTHVDYPHALSVTQGPRKRKALGDTPDTRPSSQSSTTPQIQENGSKRPRREPCNKTTENFRTSVSITPIGDRNAPTTLANDSFPNAQVTAKDFDKIRTRRATLLSMLRFPELDERLLHLKVPVGNTCQWFLNTPEYKSWLSYEELAKHQGFLWIKGKPGTGKSTLMKFLFSCAEADIGEKSDSFVIPFFFNARGSEPERTVTGCYRSLLVKLFERNPSLLEALDLLGDQAETVISRKGWQLEPLKQVLSSVIGNLTEVPLYFFIDALDECDDDELADMVCFLEDLCSRAVERGSRMHVCFSSRHFPNIVPSYGYEIVLEAECEHRKDLESYIATRIRLRGYNQVSRLQIEILRKSSGIFLWVALVVQILNKEFANGRTADLSSRLEQIPPGLSELFDMIVTRDNENLEELSYCAGIIHLANRPLIPLELYCALQHTRPSFGNTAWNPAETSVEDVSRYIVSCSRGLAEVVGTKPGTVQFIHESVQDFLVDKHNNSLSQSSRAGGIHLHGHEMMRDITMRQISSVFRSPRDVDTLLRDIHAPAGQTKEYAMNPMIGKFPFLGYAVHNVLHHSNCVQADGLPQQEFIGAFPFRLWVQLSNLFKPERQKLSQHAHSLYIFAELNLQHLIAADPRLHSHGQTSGERYGSPISAALIMGNKEAFKVLVQAFPDLPYYPSLENGMNTGRK